MLVSPYAGATCALQVLTLWVLGAAGAALALHLGHPAWAWAALAPLGAGLFVLSFYRDPERTPPADAQAWVSPADGVVTDVVEVEEPHVLRGRALRIGIFLSPLNVHVNRAPTAGEVVAVVPIAGKCLAATTPACIDQNEAVLLGLRTEAGLLVGVRQVTGALARTIVCGARPGQRLARGERYGMIKLGSRTELLVPVDAGFAPAVRVGDVVRGGETVLGRLAPQPAGRAAAAGGEAA